MASIDRIKTDFTLENSRIAIYLPSSNEFVNLHRHKIAQLVPELALVQDRQGQPHAEKRVW